MPFKRQNQTVAASQTPAVPVPQQIPDPPSGSADMVWWGQIKTIIRNMQTQLTAHQKAIANLQNA